MGKKIYIDFWLRTARDRWEAAIILMQNNKNVEALFMFCLSIEKLLKANWVNDNIDDIPPRIMIFSSFTHKQIWILIQN
ncbi:MAG: HEPN domain-containing protein [Saprospiraceae bacterium]